MGKNSLSDQWVGLTGYQGCGPSDFLRPRHRKRQDRGRIDVRRCKFRMMEVLTAGIGFEALAGKQGRAAHLVAPEDGCQHVEIRGGRRVDDIVLVRGETVLDKARAPRKSLAGRGKTRADLGNFRPVAAGQRRIELTDIFNEPANCLPFIGAQLAAHEIQRLNAVCAFVDRRNARIAEDLGDACCLNITGAAMNL